MPLTAQTPMKTFIDDFLKSDDPRFAGDSKKKRIERATAAYYAKHNEEVETPPQEPLEELSNDTLTAYKKGAIADVTSADKAGNTAKADKRVQGITKATNKQDDSGDYAKAYATTYKKGYDIAHGERAEAHAFVDADESKANAGKFANDEKVRISAKNAKKNESINESAEKRAKHVADVISGINTADPKTRAKHLAYLKGIMNSDDYAHIERQLKNEGIEMVEEIIEDVIPSAKVSFFDAVQADKLSEAREYLEEILAEKVAVKLMELKEAIAKRRGAAEGVYHDTYSDALQTAYKHTGEKGYEFEDPDYHQGTTHVDPRPHTGETKSLHFPLLKDGKPSKKALHVQVHNRGNETKSKYELNHYIA